MKTLSVSLAGRTYDVQSLKFRAEREWRKKYDAPISNLITAIGSAKQLVSTQFEKTGDLLKEVGMILLSHATDLATSLINSPDTMFEAICDYSPAIQSDRAFIEENAYQDEIAKAFIEVVQIAYPFGSMISMVTSLGRLGDGTSPNSASPSGESPKTT